MSVTVTVDETLVDTSQLDYSLNDGALPNQ